ncbi:tRNA uridine-5-carboxymethylaminomethyl(34) synthesis GTPase MnmE [Facklamia sp. DSM 111018]|uniref:tRNA modification GTPase MnmE n=1 Tax=Facklamia lactis TaxID=2749967 RepID=A0ABS0LST1_9LACT|nr:tRNA uridine-5-carboxymethylaminomethyl(34) synthesis GTPase MnmE [Facklamia lactis]MBG9981296.1 tRNA uridine-5-carboxymethylaminomethyl(34) synthesis GTPase MnmE [Facklamia lactis]MBG9987228.1 tRNA uridine-5-carboxymethylaminomethyl(34) synthesis GTPase MnmE [Facklamia lactis]
MYLTDTIAAISTALGEGAIGIVRLSGPESLNIASEMFRGKNLLEVNSHTIHYGHIIDRQDNIIDEVMVTVLKAPKTYTREDVIEINCHGGVMAVQRILEECLLLGARMAEPGEFTKRAFLNGRIDLSQAEALMDLIQAKTSRAMDASINQLQGSLSVKIRELRQEMLNTLAQVEVTIDYPEYDDVEEISTNELVLTAKNVKSKIEDILQMAQNGRLFRDGIKTAIVGRPNVGKSSLLNRLTGFDKAIVTDIAGTTRDTIEEYINIQGVPLHLVDTAGIRETNELVERIGVTKSRELIDKSDLIILVLNQTESLTEIDIELLELTQGKKRIILFNKEDLVAKIVPHDISNYAEENEVILTSMLTENGIRQLEEKIVNLFYAGNLQSTDVNYLLNSRHTNLLRQAIKLLDEVIVASYDQVPVDLIQIDYTRAWEILGEIIGDSFQDELLDKLFSQFCLGK